MEKQITKFLIAMAETAKRIRTSKAVICFGWAFLLNAQGLRRLWFESWQN